MTVAEETKSEAMTAVQIIGISAGRAMEIERVTVGHNNRVRVRDRDLVDLSKIEDLNKEVLGAHSNNRDKDLHKKPVDLSKDKDPEDLNKIEDHSKVNKDLADQDHKDLQGINKIVDHNNKDHRDLALHNNKDLKILHR